MQPNEPSNLSKDSGPYYPTQSKETSVEPLYTETSIAKPPNKSKKTLIVSLLCVAAVLLIGSLTAMYFMKKLNSPEAVFNKSLEVALETSQLEQRTDATEKEDPQKFAGIVETQYEVSDIKNPKVFYTLNQDGTQIDMYGDSQNAYVRYKLLNNEMRDVFKTVGINPEINKWTKTRDQGKVLDPETTLFAPSDPREELLGHYIFGNFQAEDKQKLLDFSKANNLYQYDPKSVSKETINNTEVYVYNVHVNTDKLEEYNRLVAPMFSISEADFEEIIDRQKLTTGGGWSSIQNVKMYISLKDKRLIKVETADESTNINVVYRNFNDVLFPEEPRVEAN